jgi:sugar phosphate isomerase/epimerase
MKDDRLSFMASLDFSSWDDLKILDVLSRLGYKGISWTLSHFNPRKKSTEELRDLVHHTRDYGMEIAEIVVQQDLVSLDDHIRMDRISLAKECIEAASECSVENVNIFTGPAPWIPESPRIPKGITEGRAWEMIIEAYEELVSLAEKCEVFLVVEAVWGHLCHDFYTLRELFSRFNSKYLAVNLDPSHY